MSDFEDFFDEGDDEYGVGEEEEYTEEVEEMNEYVEEDRIMEAERDVFGRVTKSYHFAEKRDRNVMVRFQAGVFSFNEVLKEVDLELKESEIEKLLNLLTKIIPMLSFINPEGFLLGFIISDRGKDINENKLKLVLSKLKNKKVVDYFKRGNKESTEGSIGIEPPDLIRYSKYIIKINQN